MTTTQSIDGISYASSQNVPDSRGYGIVTQILYYDQSGTEVADRYLFTDPNAPIGYGYGPKVVNSDGTFSFNIYPTGGSGIPQGYTQNTFTSDGIVTRIDSFNPIYILGPDGSTYEGSAGYTDSYALFDAAGPGSSGMINGSWYDMVETLYDSRGQALEKEYLNDLHDKQTIVAKQILASPDPVLNLPAAATASAGAVQYLPGVSLSDEWAGLNPGTLALTIRVDSGSVSGADNTGHAFTVSAGTPMNFTGTLAQIEADLGHLSYTGPTGTAHVAFQVYDQAGLRATGQETITVGAAQGTTAAADPILTGATRISALTGTPLSLNGVTFSDPWAAAHAGTLALTVSTSAGTLSDVNGNTTVSNNVVHATGTEPQIEKDLASLVLTSNQAGTETVRISVYDQAGDQAVHLVGVTVHS